MEHGHNIKHLPANLGAPASVLRFRSQALLVAVIFAVLAIVDMLITHRFDLLLRGWLMGFMVCLSFALGGMALLMIQWLSGGKWGLLLRRPLEAMTRTLPLVFLMFLPIAFFVKRLYIWAQIADPRRALQSGLINAAQAHAIDYKRPYLNIEGFWIRGIVYFAIWATFIYFLNRWSLQRDTDTQHGNWYWQKRFENLSGAGMVVYCITMSAASIDWVMSLDPTWYSSIYGMLFLVAQGYAAMALVTLVTLRLSKDEPIKTILRITEQHDLGKLLFAFVMLNIYIAFSQYLIVWSGNLPEELRWYLDRTTGGWGIVSGLDFAFHWLIPFALLLSSDLKRNKARLAGVCYIMLFARYLDNFWLIAPNFAGTARNFQFTFGLLQYIFVPAAMTGLWLAYFFTQLTTRSLVPQNDPHLPQILEPEHNHAEPAHAHA